MGLNSVQCDKDSVLLNPMLWLQLLHEYRATLTWSPNFAFALIAKEIDIYKQENRPIPQYDLKHVKYFMNAGEQVTYAACSDFINATARFGIVETMMQPAFGMAECCTCITYTNDFTLNKQATHAVHTVLNSSTTGVLKFVDNNSHSNTSNTTQFIDLGGVTPGTSIRITDNNNNVVQEGVIGRFQIKSPSVMPGYLNNPKANQESYVGEQWFDSGTIRYDTIGYDMI